MKRRPKNTLLSKLFFQIHQIKIHALIPCVVKGLLSRSQFQDPNIPSPLASSKSPIYTVAFLKRIQRNGAKNHSRTSSFQLAGIWLLSPYIIISASVVVSLLFLFRKEC
jgi:hypothetical protein